VTASSEGPATHTELRRCDTATTTAHAAVAVRTVDETEPTRGKHVTRFAKGAKRAPHHAPKVSPLVLEFGMLFTWGKRDGLGLPASLVDKEGVQPFPTRVDAIREDVAQVRRVPRTLAPTLATPSTTSFFVL
jgi:hypothetical protein